MKNKSFILPIADINTVAEVTLESVNDSVEFCMFRTTVNCGILSSVNRNISALSCISLNDNSPRTCSDIGCTNHIVLREKLKVSNATLTKAKGK